MFTCSYSVLPELKKLIFIFSTPGLSVKLQIMLLCFYIPTQTVGWKTSSILNEFINWLEFNSIAFNIDIQYLYTGETQETSRHPNRGKSITLPVTVKK